MAGSLYLVPVTLGSIEYENVIPSYVSNVTRRLRHFITEDVRSARRYLRLIDRSFPIDDSSFSILNEHTKAEQVAELLAPVIAGFDVGLMSEAGLPGIADPGSLVIREAHARNIKVVPLSGPSSIILALISSGLDGQKFSFHGYLPQKKDEREQRLRDIEKRIAKDGSQIFMETPYRASKMIESLLSACNGDTMLCIASDITLGTEFIVTKRIAEWRKNPPALDDRLVVFVLGK